MHTVNRLNRLAGWGVAIYMMHNASNNCTDLVSPAAESSLIELFGPVITDSNSPFFLGAALHTNNTGALGEARYHLVNLELEADLCIYLYSIEKYCYTQ
jgi:hypothetical protein